MEGWRGVGMITIDAYVQSNIQPKICPGRSSKHLMDPTLIVLNVLYPSRCVGSIVLNGVLIVCEVAQEGRWMSRGHSSRGRDVEEPSIPFVCLT